MKKYGTLIATVLFLIILASCRHDDYVVEQPLSREALMIKNYFTQLKSSISTNNLDGLTNVENSLTYSSLKRYTNQYGHTLLIVDVKPFGDFVTKKESPKAVFILDRSKFLDGTIAGFTNPSSDDNGILSSIFNGTFRAKDYTGKISMYDLSGRLMFFNEATNGKITLYGYTKPKLKQPSANAKVTNCIDWYLVTYYGGSIVSETYLYSDCACGGDQARIAAGSARIANNCGGGGGGSSETGPNPPPSPADGQKYTFKDKDGVTYVYIAQGNVWHIESITLSPVAVTAQPNTFSFLQMDGPPEDGFQVQGPDTFTYTYSSWAGTWFGINSADLMNKFNGFSANSEALNDPPRPHINVKITNRCQADALRQLINNAAIAEAEYNAAMNNCLISVGFGSAAIEIANQGGFFKMIIQQMKGAGGKGLGGYHAAMITLGFGSLAAAVCVDDNYKILQAKYNQLESDFKTVYDQPCNN